MRSIFHTPVDTSVGACIKLELMFSVTGPYYRAVFPVWKHNRRSDAIRQYVIYVKTVLRFYVEGFTNMPYFCWTFPLPVLTVLSLWIDRN